MAAAGAAGYPFNAVLWTGDASTPRTIGGIGLPPSLVWIKDRTTGGGNDHHLYDELRGATKYLRSNGANAEVTAAQGLQSFNTNGFTIGSTSNVNASGEDYVGWCWKADKTATHASHDGERYSLESGLSIIKYAGTGANKTINHSLGATLKLKMIKNLDAADSWKVYHSGVASDPETDYLVLDTNTNAVDDNTVWNDTAPTSTQFTIGTHTDVNTNAENYIAYLFADVAGFSKFGYYTGDATNPGPTITTSFPVGFVIIKGVDNTAGQQWYMYDKARDPTNPADRALFCNAASAESGYAGVDFDPTGFQIRNTGPALNESGKRYVYAAFAEAA